jgi:hypothetical protein
MTPTILMLVAGFWFACLVVAVVWLGGSVADVPDDMDI